MSLEPPAWWRSACGLVSGAAMACGALSLLALHRCPSSCLHTSQRLIYVLSTLVPLLIATINLVAPPYVHLAENGMALTQSPLGHSHPRLIHVYVCLIFESFYATFARFVNLFFFAIAWKDFDANHYINSRGSSGRVAVVVGGNCIYLLLMACTFYALSSPRNLLKELAIAGNRTSTSNSIGFVLTWEGASSSLEWLRCYAAVAFVVALALLPLALCCRITRMIDESFAHWNVRESLAARDHVRGALKIQLVVCGLCNHAPLSTAFFLPLLRLPMLAELSLPLSTFLVLDPLVQQLLILCQLPALRRTLADMLLGERLRRLLCLAKPPSASQSIQADSSASNAAVRNGAFFRRRSPARGDVHYGVRSEAVTIEQPTQATTLASSVASHSTNATFLPPPLKMLSNCQS